MSIEIPHPICNVVEVQSLNVLKKTTKDGSVKIPTQEGLIQIHATLS